MPILQWLNREEHLTAASRASYRLLKADPDLSYGNANTENMLIQGDNLEALKALLPYYAGKVKCIYIDPPYNTKAFQNEHYNDNLEHSEWLEMIYPRLELLWDLLDENGYLTVQIDDKQFARLYLVMCEIMGESNLKTICVKMSEATGVKMASVNKKGSIPKLKEYIILASKSGISGLNIRKIPKGKWDYEYKTYLHGVNKDDLQAVKDIIHNDNRSLEDIQFVDRVMSNVSFENMNDVAKRELGKKPTEEWLYQNAWRIVQIATLTGGARDLAQKKKQELQGRSTAFSIITPKQKMYIIKKDFNHETKLPRCKFLFADEYLEVHPGDFWQDIKTTGLDNEGGVDFKKSKKPELLIKRIIEMCTNKGDLVLDSFLGSGTTAAVAHKMGRKYIGIEMGDHAKTHCAVRLRKVIDGEQGGISKAVSWNGGGGYRFYQLGEAIFDEFGQINKEIKFDALAAHIWFSETKTPMTETPTTPLLGVHNGTAYYLLYNGILGDKRPQGGNVLTSKILRDLPPHDGAKVIYGETSRIGAVRLDDENIIFKQTPYDIKAR